jgi:hypothetical protein
MENINTLDNEGLQELGKQIQLSIKEMMHLHNNGDQFPNMVRNVTTFENRVNGSNEWVQANISLTYDPLCFNDEDCTLLYWLPPKVGTEITETYLKGLKQIVMLLIEANTDNRVVDKVLDISEETIKDISKILYAQK